MELRVRTEEGIRVIGDHKNDNIIDVNGVVYDSLAIDLYPRFYYKPLTFGGWLINQEWHYERTQQNYIFVKNI